MLSSGKPLWAGVDIAVPRSSDRLPGIHMAGFHRCSPTLMELAMVAHPSVTILVDLSEEEGLGYGAHGRGSVVVGLLPGNLRVGGRVGACLQVRLEPAVAAAVLGASAELSGMAVPLKEVWGREAARAEDRLRAAASWDERFAIVADILERRLGPGPRVDPEVAFTWRRTLGRRGRVRVENLADEVGWSRKRLWARFRSQLGISPKHAARLVRFDHAAYLLAAGRTPAAAAAESGYADQSHLHRETKEFTELTPAAVALAPWLAIDDVAWPASLPTRSTHTGGPRIPDPR
ncbi:helix-turn-helix domain-containing protein [Streptomyces sp. NPDC003077]|uniref:helix-turn-helix domain-containing protein n=1 Tax=Streptomyces sp. NPDC003077 TaxID=3154443 RepID=UPI0033AB233C